MIGHEIAKTRPAVVISNDVGNQHSDRVIVAAISSSHTRVYPFEVLLRSGEGGLTRDSKALLDQIRTVDKVRLGQKLGSLSLERIAEIDRAMMLSLGLRRPKG